MFKDFISTLVTTIIAVSGAVADSAGNLTAKLGDVLVPVTTTSISYARVPAPPVQAPTGIVRGESTTTPSTSTTVITQPVIERVIETVRTVGTSGMSVADLDARLSAFAYDFTNRLKLHSNTGLRQDEILSDSIGETLAGDLSGLTVADSSWAGGTITNATITGGSISNYLPLSGGTVSGDLAVTGNFTVSGTQTLSGAITIPYLVATSTTASSFLGNVGIGTTTPGQKLDVEGSGDTRIRVGTNGAGQYSGFELQDPVNNQFRGGLFLPAYNSKKVELWTSNSGSVPVLAMTLTQHDAFGANPLVGIGSTTPFATLTVRGNSSGGSPLWIESSAGSPLLNVISTGNVGIGQTSPTYKLDVTGLGRFTGLVDAANFVATSTTATSTLAGGFIAGAIGNAFTVNQNGRASFGQYAPDALAQVKVTGDLWVGSGGKLVLGLTPNVAMTRFQTIFGDSAQNDLTFRTYRDYLFETDAGDNTAGTNRLTIKATTGNVGIGTTSPWRKLSVTGTVGFDGLTGATGAGSLCLDSNKQVVYNSASDNCLSSTRATKHDINPLVLDALSQVLALQPVSFIYNEGDGRTRYGFIAEDTAAVDEHLATYDASSTVSGIDDRSIIAILVGAIKDLYAKMQEYFARTERLEERVSALEAQLASSAAAGATAGNGQLLEAPAASSEPEAESADTASSTTPVEAATTPEAPAAANDNLQPQEAEQSSHDGNEPASVNLADENGQAQEQKKQPDTQPQEATTLSEHGPPPLPTNDNIPPTEDLAPTGTE